jgi:mono/diheme cytochrome c family protein
MKKRNLTAKVIPIGVFLILVLGGALFGTRWPPLGATAVEAQRGGAAVYSQNCARCHGADGRAQTSKGRQTDAVDLTSDDWTPDTEHDIRIVNNGKKSMPAFKRRLTPAQISAVVQYIRRFKH